MLVKVLYFASLREKLFVTEEEVALESGNTVADLLKLLRGRGGQWHELLATETAVRVAVDHEFSSLDTELSADCEVGLFPPVTGG